MPAPDRTSSRRSTAHRPVPPPPAMSGDPSARPIGLPPGLDEAVDAPDDRSFLRRRLDAVDAWCDGRWWAVRVPLLLYLVVAWLGHAADSNYQSLFKGIDLGIHELGHFVFQPFGDVMAAWGGSLLQCLVPCIAVPMFLRQRDYFAVAIAFGWLGVNLFEVATYAADAVAMQLPLVTPGGGHPIHDWNFVLGALGWLRHTELIAGLHRLGGHAALAIGVGGGAWLCAKMLRSQLARARS